jgi:DNA recombination protein RmuC
MLGLVIAGTITYLLLRARIVAASAAAETQTARLRTLEPFEAEVQTLRERLTRLNEVEALAAERLTKLMASETKAASEAARAGGLAGTILSLEAAASTQSQEIDKLRRDNSALKEDVSKAQSEAKATQATLDAERVAQTDKVATLTSVKEQIEKDLQLLSNNLLKQNSDDFLKKASDFLEQRQKDSQTNLESLMNPVAETLKQYQKKLDDMEKERKQDEGQLAQQLRHVAEAHAKIQSSTDQLVNALKSSPNTRGRWGEHQLLRILEMAGMMQHVDFEANKSIDTDEGKIRPDIVIRMPHGKHIVIDSKVPMSAYLTAVDATTPDEREVALKLHASQLRDHAIKLGAKNYSDAIVESADFVVMFIPGDNLYAAAIERDPDLFEDAYRTNVIIVTPTTFLALAKAIAYGWSQDEASKATKQTVELGVELYKRMSALGSKITGLTRALTNTVTKHNELIGTLEATVLPQARKFHQLPGAATHGAIEEATLIETSVREARPDKDLKFDDGDDIE